MRITRIDAFDTNFEECAADKKYKFEGSRGAGEKRIYVGNDERLLDDFFDLENTESFFMLKRDLQNYLVEAKDEFFHPTQDYKNDLSVYYEENVTNTNNIVEDVIKLHFTKKYDSQNRYYLNFKDDGYSSSNWYFLRNIALPRVTKLNFVKIRDIDRNKIYIYIKPTFYIDEREIEERIIFEELLKDNHETIENYRKGQAKWRKELLDIMPQCIITEVTENRILQACHIKPHNHSLKDGKINELYDINNGLIMTPTYHLLFDIGFISFENDGTIMISPFLSNLNKQRLQLKENYKYNIPCDCSTYLEYHRNHVYIKLPDNLEFDID